MATSRNYSARLKREGYFVRLREIEDTRHRLMGSSSLVDRYLHAVRLKSEAEARSSAFWMFANNPGHFVSAQIVQADGRVLETLPAPDAEVSWPVGHYFNAREGAAA
jgi:hypothetical protein